MKFFSIYFPLLITIITLLGCKKSTKSSTEIDNKSYIMDFELLQENPNNQTSIKITSPKATVDPSNNNLEILESTIEVLTKDGQDFRIKSGNSILNNITNSIKVFNSVNISFLNRPDYYITTNSFLWDMQTSIIDINNPVKVNFNNTKITATNGSYNIESKLLRIVNSDFNRVNFNSEGHVDYEIKIKSDFAKWFKKDNTFVFRSKEKQVETTINFLITK